MNSITRKRFAAGGKAVRDKVPPGKCPQCARSMQGRSWHSYLGHLGLHGLANKYFGGDVKSAQRCLARNGLARQDPFKANGAWRPYVPIRELLSVPDVKLRWEEISEQVF